MMRGDLPFKLGEPLTCPSLCRNAWRILSPGEAENAGDDLQAKTTTLKRNMDRVLEQKNITCPKMVTKQSKYMDQLRAAGKDGACSPHMAWPSVKPADCLNEQLLLHGVAFTKDSLFNILSNSLDIRYAGSNAGEGCARLKR